MVFWIIFNEYVMQIECCLFQLWLVFYVNSSDVIMIVWSQRLTNHTPSIYLVRCKRAKHFTFKCFSISFYNKYSLCFSAQVIVNAIQLSLKIAANPAPMNLFHLVNAVMCVQCTICTHSNQTHVTSIDYDLLAKRWICYVYNMCISVRRSVDEWIKLDWA